MITTTQARVLFVAGSILPALLLLAAALDVNRRRRA